MYSVVCWSIAALKKSKQWNKTNNEIIIQECCYTLLSFSPSHCGSKVLNDWKPELILCIRRLSFELAISLRCLFSSTQFSMDSWGELSPKLHHSTQSKQKSKNNGICMHCRPTCLMIIETFVKTLVTTHTAIKEAWRKQCALMLFFSKMHQLFTR